ncbi:MAG TPA: hypothetical protein VD763_05885 [Candidatus Saccharimonadales bacterium]|nr:hypothetical protein [Candidatus Saccharimonadales bacterium]
MPPRTAAQILAEWHELAIQREEASDSEIAAGLAARIEQIRREYIEGTPPEDGSDSGTTHPDPDPTIQLKLRL